MGHSPRRSHQVAHTLGPAQSSFLALISGVPVHLPRYRAASAMVAGVKRQETSSSIIPLPVPALPPPSLCPPLPLLLIKAGGGKNSHVRKKEPPPHPALADRYRHLPKFLPLFVHATPSQTYSLFPSVPPTAGHTHVRHEANPNAIFPPQRLQASPSLE